MEIAAAKKVAGFVASAFITFTTPLFAEANAWAKGADGNWAETNAWSAGRLPSMSDEVTLNSAPVTVTIDSNTAQLAPSSLSVRKINLWPANTLLLTDLGDAPFSAGVMDNGSGRFIQVGGSSRFGGVLLHNGSDTLFARTNATVAITNFLSINGTSLQVGGTTWIGAFSCHGGSNVVENGLMHIDGTMWCVGDQSPVTFIQNGGRTEAGPLTMTVGSMAHYPIHYTLDNYGTLITGDTYIGPYASFRNISGNHVINGNLLIQGGLSGHYNSSPQYGEYECGGTLTARNLTLDQYGFSRFDASGEVHITEDISFSGNPDFQSAFSISGLVTCSNLRSEGTDIDLIQTGGALIVSNLFSYGGRYSGYYYDHHGARPSQYLFTGGTMTANDIKLDSEWIIQSANIAFRVSNPGTFTMGGFLHLIDGEEHLGRFILRSNALIDLAGSSAKLSFDSSSAQAWNWSATLTVSNWDGSLTGGGLDQLAFGNSPSGLNDHQLAQIRFVNPGGFASGIYDAQILANGEIVPSSFIASLPPPSAPPPPPPPPSVPAPPKQGGLISGVENLQVLVRFFATSNAPTAATGMLRLKAHNDDGTNLMQMKITTRGLNAGTYDITAVLKSDGSTTSLGQVTIGTAGQTQPKPILLSESYVALPTDVSPMDIGQVTISDSTGVLLIADVLNAPGNSLSILNGRVRVRSTDSAVHGTAVLQTFARRGKQSGHFSMTVLGLAPNTTYHVVVNDIDFGTVGSTKSGRIALRNLRGADLTTVASVQLQDGNGTTIAEAAF